jgi:hypothetical protein
MLRPITLLVAALMSAHAFWSALVRHQSSLTTALIWFLVAVPVAGILLGALESLAATYRRTNARTRRAADAAAEDGSAR